MKGVAGLRARVLKAFFQRRPAPPRFDPWGLDSMPNTRALTREELLAGPAWELRRSAWMMRWRRG